MSLHQSFRQLRLLRSLYVCRSARVDETSESQGLSPCIYVCPRFRGAMKLFSPCTERMKNVFSSLYCVMVSLFRLTNLDKFAWGRFFLPIVSSITYYPKKKKGWNIPRILATSAFYTPLNNETLFFLTVWIPFSIEFVPSERQWNQDGREGIPAHAGCLFLKEQLWGWETGWDGTDWYGMRYCVFGLWMALRMSLVPPTSSHKLGTVAA